MKLRAVLASISGLAALAVIGGGTLCLAQDVAGTINTIAGNGSLGFAGDGGPATSARISAPDGLALDQTGNLFIVDNGNNRIRKMDKSGVIGTVAGNGSSGFSGDGGPAISATFSWGFNGHLGIAVDQSGNLYIADLSDERVRRVDSNGIVTTWPAMESGTIQGMAVRPPAPDLWTRSP